MTTREQPIIAPIPLAVLLDMVPFDPYNNPPWWGCAALDVTEVLTCTAPDPGRKDWGAGQSREDHTARVGWLVRNWANDGTDPIDVEVWRGVVVHDGWHRISAAIARRDTFIHAEVSGNLDEALDYGFPLEPFLPARSSAT